MKTQNIGRVLLWTLGTLLSFAGMAVSIRLLAGRLSIFEILTVRNAGALIILLLLVALRPQLRKDIASNRLRMHFLRSVVHFGGTYSWALSLTLLPFATVFALEFTLPVWVLILAIAFLGEKLTFGRVMVIALGFIGCLIILRPGMQAFQSASLLVLVAGFLYAVFNVLTKQMTSSDSIFAIVFWMNLMQLPMALLGSDPLFFMKIEGWQILSAMGVAVAGLSAHYCLANAFRYGDASLVVPLDFLRVPLIAIIGWWFFGEAVDIWVFVGALIILAGILWNLRDEAKRAQIAPKDAMIASH